MAMNGKRLAVLLGLLLMIAVLPHLSHAQRSKIPRIGLLFVPSESVHSRLVGAFRQGMRELGYIEGRTVFFEGRYADGQADRLPRLAAELVALNVDVIVTAASPAVSAAGRATSTIPIVFAAVGDAVAAGHVSSLARPGGNITGLSLLGKELSSKRLELLKELYPRAARLAVLFNPQDHGMAIRVAEAQAAARALGLSVLLLEIKTPKEFEHAFSTMTKEHPDAILTVVDGLTMAHRKRIIDFAAENRLPAIYETKEFTETGGLMSYGPDLSENYRRAAMFVDKILKGTKPTDLPVEQPSTFEFVVNLKTARALGIAVPQALLLRADKIIE